MCFGVNAAAEVAAVVDEMAMFGPVVEELAGAPDDSLPPWLRERSW